ncbi:unnamed protein product [Boreogadus saida]
MNTTTDATRSVSIFTPVVFPSLEGSLCHVTLNSPGSSHGRTSETNPSHTEAHLSAALSASRPSTRRERERTHRRPRAPTARQSPRLTDGLKRQKPPCVCTGVRRHTSRSDAPFNNTGAIGHASLMYGRRPSVWEGVDVGCAAGPQPLAVSHRQAGPAEPRAPEASDRTVWIRSASATS